MMMKRDAVVAELDRVMMIVEPSLTVVRPIFDKQDGLVVAAAVVIAAHLW